MTRLHRYTGACHCGNLAVRFDSERTPAELGLRTDPCSFCLKHHGRYISDPAGALHVTVREPALLQRYRFGTRTADFLLCRDCGVFVGAVMPEDALGIVNVHALDAREAFLANPVQVSDFEGETVEQRLARRRARWTPVASFVEGA